MYLKSKSIAYHICCSSKLNSVRNFITSILNSLVILAIWFVVSSAIYFQIALFFALNRIFFSANEDETVKQNNQSDLKVFLTNQSHRRKMKDKKAIVWQLNIWNHTCDFKSNLCCALVRFWNHTYDFWPNCTPLSSITIIYFYIIVGYFEFFLAPFLFALYGARQYLDVQINCFAYHA